ncbi:serine hydrolase domain-containing protein [Streptomyces sp. NPDC048172]|uniref:serine hydrolase domain-containing protein n=1 Tax=Streptomyces sp. NPDC048172 TaxID=3365505 RepID=UPI00371921A8
MRRRTSLAAGLAFTASLVTAPLAVAAPRTAPECDTGPFETALKELRKAGASGMTVTVKSPRCGVRSAGVGLADLRTGREAVGDEHSRLASNTKTWTATVVLQLVGEGGLRLDDTVDDHLPGLIRTRHYDGRAITVRQLLQHTSGLPDYLEAPFWEDLEAHRWDHVEPLRTVEQSLALPPPERAPSGFSYSNTNYNLAGLIVTEITGRGIGAEIDRRIVRRLGLRDTHWPGDRTTLPRPELRGYVERPGKKLVDKTEWNTSAADASGALVSTGADTTAFWTALWSGELLGPAELAEMRRTVEDGEGGRYGLGVERYERVPGSVSWGHSGYMETGHKVRNAVSDDGRRAVTLLIGSESFDEAKVDSVVDTLLRELR